MIDAAQRTLDGLERIRSQSQHDQQGESVKFETEYRRAVIRNLDRMELFGVDLSRASKSHPLSVAYVSLDVGASLQSPVQEVDLEEGGRGQEDGEGESGEWEEEEAGEGKATQEAVHSVEMALAGSMRILVKGAAGAGKTTLVRWIAVRAASRDFEYPLQDWNAAIPFLIRLRNFSSAALPAPQDFPSLVASTIADAMPRGWVHQKLRSGNAVVMIDGVDEVAEARRDEVRKWIAELAGAFPTARFIVTSRPHAAEEGWLEADGFGEADLQPMDTTSIERFVDHWHTAVADEVHREDEVLTLQRLAQNLKATLRSNRAIRRLATNPLLCGANRALHRDTNEQLPEDRLELYERCCSMLLERRDPESGLAISGYPRLTYRQKRALLDDLAYWMIKNEWTEVAFNSARDRLDKKRRDAPDRRERWHTCDRPERPRVPSRKRTGTLREPVDGKSSTPPPDFPGIHGGQRRRGRGRHRDVSRERHESAVEGGDRPRRRPCCGGGRKGRPDHVSAQEGRQRPCR